MGRQKKKVAFLFGAGCEGPGNYDIPLGFDFMKRALFTKAFKPAVLDALGKFFSFENDFFKYSRHTVWDSGKVLKQLLLTRLEEEPDLYGRFRDDYEKVLTEDDKNELKLLPEFSQTGFAPGSRYDKQFVSRLASELERIVREKAFPRAEIESGLLRELFAEDKNGNAVIDFNVGIGGMLDAYFHTIICPKKYGGVRFAKIFNYYWSCYFAVAEPVAAYLARHGCALGDYWDREKGLCCQKVLENLGDFTRKLYEAKTGQAGGEPVTYYERLGALFDEAEDLACSGVITTNYYKFAECLSPKIAYLNGQLKWFELPETLTALDLSKADQPAKAVFFPFIFGQSLVKPIVNRLQTEEYARFSRCLDESDLLCVLGFNMNEDDNHINSFLHDFVADGGTLLIVRPEGETSDARRKIRCETGKVEYCDVVYGDNAAVTARIMRRVRECLGIG